MNKIERCYLSNHGAVFDTEEGTYVITDMDILVQYVMENGHRVHFNL